MVKTKLRTKKKESWGGGEQQKKLKIKKKSVLKFIRHR